VLASFCEASGDDCAVASPMERAKATDQPLVLAIGRLSKMAPMPMTLVLILTWSPKPGASSIAASMKRDTHNNRAQHGFMNSY